MIRSALLAALLSISFAGATHAQGNCQPTVHKTTTYNPGLFCATHTYCYEVCNPGNCTLPVASITIDFACGVDQLDASSIQSPDGWSGAVNPATNQLTWSTIARRKQIQPGQCLTFCVTTICHPRCVEGRQGVQCFTELGLPISGVQQVAIHITTDYRTWLGGDPYAPLGSNFFVTVSDPVSPGGVDYLFASPLPITPGLWIGDLGTLHLDPLLVLPVGPMPLDGLGHGQLALPIPPDPALSGATLGLQALTIEPTSPRLSSPLSVTLR
ncbi:MAG: hypothetical protein AB7I19_17620 [Planctomycetota bacterium]